MIRAYTNNDDVVQAISDAAATKGLEAEFLSLIDPLEIRAAAESLDVIIFDLTAATLSLETVVGVLDVLDVELAPPVLYLLTNAADIELLTQAGSIVNQDYAFLPLDPAQLAGRLEVLTILGQRRKLTLETAITDRLTGLYNRKYFLRRLEEEMYRATRYKYAVGVLLADVDFAAEGHELTEQTGTAVVKEIAAFLAGRLRKTDIVARYKWDDFAFLLPEISREDSLLVAEDVRNKLELLEVSSEGRAVHLDVHLGHLCFPAEGLKSAIEVMEALEECTFKARTGGGAKLVSYNAGTAAPTEE